MPRDGSERGVAAWLRRWWRALVAELVATALLVLLGIATMLPLGDQPPPLAHTALGFGFMVLANVEVFGPVSGAHMNPAVTLAAVLDRRLAPVPAVAYVVAQLVGSVLGFGTLMALAPQAFNSSEIAVTGATAPAAGVTALAAVFVEMLLTGVLVLVCCAVWAAHDVSGPDRSVPIKLGLTITGLIYAGGVLTGASLNPARSFAPELLQKFRKDHWVYWVGPLGGAALGALLHRLALRPAAPAPPAHHAPRGLDALPLHDKPLADL